MVIPAHAGIQIASTMPDSPFAVFLDPSLRWNDVAVCLSDRNPLVLSLSKGRTSQVLE